MQYCWHALLPVQCMAFRSSFLCFLFGILLVLLLLPGESEVQTHSPSFLAIISFDITYNIKDNQFGCMQVSAGCIVQDSNNWPVCTGTISHRKQSRCYEPRLLKLLPWQILANECTEDNLHHLVCSIHSLAFVQTRGSVPHILLQGIRLWAWYNMM